METPEIIYDLTQPRRVYGGPIPTEAPKGEIIVTQLIDPDAGEAEYCIDTHSGCLGNLCRNEIRLSSQALLRDGEMALVVVSSRDGREYRRVTNVGGESVVAEVSPELYCEYRDICRMLACAENICRPPLDAGTVKGFVEQWGREPKLVVAVNDDAEAARRRDYGDDGMDGMFDPDRN